MSENKEKKFSKLFKLNMKDKIQDAAEKIVTEKIQQKIKKLESDMKYIARQRDVIFLSTCGLLISNIAFIILWILT